MNLRNYLYRIVLLFIVLHLCCIAHAKDKPPFALSGGCITSGTQWVLYNSIPTTIAATVASGGICSPYSYQWQKSTDNIYFTDIPGATGQNLTFTASLPDTTFFQRKTICGNEVAYTTSVVVNMITKFYFNVKDSAVYTRNNCATGGTPGTYKYVVPASKHSSPTSQAEADGKAKKDLTDSGQYFANIRAVCTWYSAPLSGVFTRNNCGTGATPGTYTYVLRDKKHSSTISALDAEAKAKTDLADSGQYFANRLAVCTWYNVARDSTATKSGCPTGTTATSYKYTVAAKKHSSTISQADADAKANKDIKDSTQLKANTFGACQNLFITMPPGATDPGTFSVTVKNTAGTVLYYKSLEDFNLPFAAALPAGSNYIVEMAAMGTMYAEVNGIQKTVSSTVSWNTNSIINIYVSGKARVYNEPQSGTFIKSCGTGYIGSEMTCGIGGGLYGSYFNVDDANQQARSVMAVNCQASVESTGTCTLIQYVNFTLKNSFIGGGLYGSTVKFYRGSNLVQTVTFPSTGSGTVPVTLPAGSYTMTFTIPNQGQPFRIGFRLQTGNSWTQTSYSQTTITTEPITFNYGTAYTITCFNDISQ